MASFDSSVLNRTTSARAHVTSEQIPGPKFDDRLMHFCFHSFLQSDLAVLENLADARAQSPRLRIDDLKFLLDADGENVRISHVAYALAIP